ncbi:acetylhydrolase [Paraglaciecola sp. L1A13]|uniref:alpha/beta hydrolase family protein n=1 Tax=Paraglaciecola sp. L1A13 TaxID=2686359 RepID=UPI00131C575F|nr:acetylhydrolase [Paraglaciecola sp. L1A13]
MKVKTTSWCLLALLTVTGSAVSAPSAEHLYTQQPSVTPELASPGQYAVGVKTLNVVHKKQLNTQTFTSQADRPLTLEVWYPADDKAATETLATYENVTRLHKPFSLIGTSHRDAAPKASGQFPLVVLSHGYTGYRTIMYYLGEHLASHGYVVVGIDHTDSTTADVDFVNSGFSGFPSTLINRARDQQFVLDYFSQDDSAIASITDTDDAAVIGYSMGGFGAVNTIGACYDFNQAGLQRLGFPEETAKQLMPIFNSCNAGRDTVDPRWKAMIAYAPWGGETSVHDAESMAKITVPSLYVSGDQDDVSGYENGVKKLFEQTGSQDKYMMVFENARHNIAPHPAPKVAYETDADLGHYIEPSWNNEQLNRINEHMSLAFLDCFVKSDANKCAYLPKRESATQVKGSDGKLTEAWPGFADRWATGIDFYRGTNAK